MEIPKFASRTSGVKSGSFPATEFSTPRGQAQPLMGSKFHENEASPSRLGSLPVEAKVPLATKSVDASIYLPSPREDVTDTPGGVRQSFLGNLFRRKQAHMDCASSRSSIDPSPSQTVIGNQGAARASVFGILGNIVLNKGRKSTPSRSPSVSSVEKLSEPASAWDDASSAGLIPESDSAPPIVSSKSITVKEQSDPLPVEEAVEDEEIPVESPSSSSESSSESSDGSQIELLNPATSRSAASEDSDYGPTLLYNWGSVVDKLLVGDAHPGTGMEARYSKQQKMAKAVDTRLGPASLIDDQMFSMASDVLRQSTDLRIFFKDESPQITSRHCTTDFTPNESDLEAGTHALAEEALDPSQCRVFGAGLVGGVAGVISEFSIRAVTFSGHFMTRGGMRFEVYVLPVEGPNPAEGGSDITLKRPHMTQSAIPGETSNGNNRPLVAQVLDNEDGTYTVFFVCSLAVRHQIVILLDGQVAVADSPYIVSIAPGRICAGQCIAWGDSLEHFSVNGEINDFIVQARDEHGNNMRRGGEKPTVEAVGAVKVVEVLDFNDGLYRVKFYVRAGCEEQFCQLNVRYDGQHIQGSPFVLKPRSRSSVQPSVHIPVKAYAALDLVNPATSLFAAMQTFSSRTPPFEVPTLPTFPPVPSKGDADEVLSKLFGQLEFADVDTASQQMQKIRKELRMHYSSLLQKEEDLEAMLNCVAQHVFAGRLQSAHEAASQQRLQALETGVAEIQEQLDTTYKSVQHRVVDSLPVSFELEDPKVVREQQEERRAKLRQVHERMEKKLEELRSREMAVKTQIGEYIKKLTGELQVREEALGMEQRALKLSTRQVLKLTKQRIKKHQRRESLAACEREPVEAKKSEYWQKEFQTMLIDTPIQTTRQPSACTATPKRQITSQLESKTPDTRPVDPESVAYWFTNIQYPEPDMDGMKPFASARNIHSRPQSFRSGGGSNPSQVVRKIVSADSHSWTSDQGHPIKKATVSRNSLNAPPGVRQRPLLEK